MGSAVQIQVEDHDWSRAVGPAVIGRAQKGRVSVEGIEGEFISSPPPLSTGSTRQMPQTSPLFWPLAPHPMGGRRLLQAPTPGAGGGRLVGYLPPVGGQLSTAHIAHGLFFPTLR